MAEPATAKHLCQARHAVPLLNQGRIGSTLPGVDAGHSMLCPYETVGGSASRGSVK